MAAPILAFPARVAGGPVLPYPSGMPAYSLDLRERIVAALKAGQSERQVAARFGVSESTVTRYDRLERTGRPLAPGRAPGRAPLLRPEQEGAFLALVATRTDWTLETLRHAWQADAGSGGALLSKSALQEHLRRLKVTYKKSKYAEERSDQKRAAFRERAEKIAPERLVFLDECGFSLNLYRLYCWAPAKERCVEAVPSCAARAARCWAR